jgi:hypothetical protein
MDVSEFCQIPCSNLTKYKCEYLFCKSIKFTESDSLYRHHDPLLESVWGVYEQIETIIA